MTLTQVRQLLTELDIRPSKALGQNFLIDGNILRILIEQADLRGDETVLEIGPGLGVLTVELVARAKRVVAIEKDKRLWLYLRDHVDGVELIEGDAVEILEQPHFHIAPPYKVVSNLPYSISTPILERLVEREDQPRAMVLTLQREVANRLAATPRHKDYGALITSDIADVKNVGNRTAGSITAGYFLKHFVGSVPWAHMDIAGTAWGDEAKPYRAKGPTGIAVRTLLKIVDRASGSNNHRPQK